MAPDKPLDSIAYILIFIFLMLLSYAGYLANKSIDYQILKKLEAQPLILPPPATASAELSPSPPGN